MEDSKLWSCGLYKECPHTLNTSILAGGTGFESRGTFKRWKLTVEGRLRQPGGFEAQPHLLPSVCSLIEMPPLVLLPFPLCHYISYLFYGCDRTHDQKQLKRKLILA